MFSSIGPFFLKHTKYFLCDSVEAETPSSKFGPGKPWDQSFVIYTSDGSIRLPPFISNVDLHLFEITYISYILLIHKFLVLLIEHTWELEPMKCSGYSKFYQNRMCLISKKTFQIFLHISFFLPFISKSL